jgi:hypothetical protein
VTLHICEHFFYTTLLGLLDPEDGGNTILQNIWKYSSKLAVSQPKGTLIFSNSYRNEKSKKIPPLTCTHDDNKLFLFLNMK